MLPEKKRFSSGKRLAAALCLICLCSLCPPPPAAAAPLKASISTGVQYKPILDLARQLGFFSEQDLEVTVTAHVQGKPIMEQMFAGKSDFAITVETPVVHFALLRDDFRILASVGTNENIQRILARKDQGIMLPADLKGRRIGVPPNTGTHFFTDLFLRKHGILPEEVSWVFREGRELPELLSSGSVDAIAIVAQGAIASQRSLGQKLVVFTEPGLCHSNFLIMAMRDTLQQPEKAERLLRALRKTEQHLDAHPERLVSLLMASEGLAKEEARQLAADFRFQVALPRVLLLTLEDNARWALENGFSTGKRIPSFSDFFAPAPLRLLDPGAVTYE